MAEVKDLAQIKAKFARRGAAASADYSEGVKRPKRDWKEATLAAVERHRQGTEAALARNAFAAGVTNTSTEEWKKAVTTKGTQRYAQGVRGSADKYARNFQPYHDTLKNLELPERGPAGDPNNIQRVVAVATAMRETKENLQGGSR